MAILIQPDKPATKRVKNLGWLLANWTLITRIYLVKSASRYYDGFLIAHLFDGRVYLTSYASFDVARRFLSRSIFRGLPLNDCGTETDLA